MGYYADLIKAKQNAKEEKKNENFHYLGKTFSVTSGNFKQVRQQVQKAYWDKVKELEVKLRSAEGSEKQSIEKELREIREGYKETLEEFDRFNNEKEEKDNEDPQIATLRRKALQKIKEAQKKADWYGDTVMQKFEKDITYAEEEEVPELAGALDRYLPKFEAKVKSFGNSDEEKGYYAKLAEEKKEKSNADPERYGEVYWKCVRGLEACGRAYSLLFNAVGGVEEVLNYGIDPDKDQSPALAQKLESWKRILENCERQLRTIKK
jgi:hypothetical protein